MKHIIPCLCLRALLGAALFVSITVSGRAALSGPDAVVAINNARIDAQTKIIEQIKGIQVGDSQMLSNMVDFTGERASASEGVVRGVKFGEPRIEGDICFIEAEVTLQQVVENVNTLLVKNGGPQISHESVAVRNNLRLIRAVGAGTVKSKAEPMEEPEIQDDGMGAALAALSGSGQRKLEALQMARLDALVQLAQQVKGVRISDQATVYDLSDSGRFTTSETDALLRGAVVVRYKALQSDLVACTMQITYQKLVENIESTYRKKTVGGLVVSESLNERVRIHNPGLTRVEATGHGSIGRRAASVSTEVIGSVE